MYKIRRACRYWIGIIVYKRRVKIYLHKVSFLPIFRMHSSIGGSRSIQNKIDSLITWYGIKNTSLSRQLNSQLQLYRDVFLSITRHLSMNWPISIFVWKVHFCNYYLLSPLRLLESSKSWITKQQSNFHICLRLNSPASLTNLIW